MEKLKDEGVGIAELPKNDNEYPFGNFSSQSSINRYRESQEEVVDRIIDAFKEGRKVVVINAPTGSGKSIIGMMAGHKTGDKVNYLCSSKALQDQLLEDFPEAKMIKGRGNYMCNLLVGYHTRKPYMTAASCLKKCKEYKCGDIGCDYYDQKKRVLGSRYRILNTYYYLYEANYARGFSAQKMVVIDEADTLDDILTGFIELFISKSQVNSYGLKLPEYLTKHEAWVEWAEDAYGKLVGQYDPSIVSHGLDKEYIKGVMFVRKLELFIDLVDKTWLFERNHKGWSFKPLWLTPEMTSRFLFSHSDRFVLMSATLPQKPVLCRTLGLDPKDVEYVEVDSVYPVENRYIHYVPIVEMSYKNKHETWKVIDEIERILDKHKDVKGIIHSTSYALRDLIMEIANDRLITHDTGDKEAMLEIFKDSEDPLVFVSPSSERGISLDDDLGRFVIWPKVPFLNLKDKKVQGRCYSGAYGSNWYGSEAAQAIVQGAGRCVRNINDYAVTYILDANFKRVIKYTPEWFRESIIYD